MKDGILKKIGKTAKVALAFLPVALVGVGLTCATGSVIAGGVNNTIASNRIESYAETDEFAKSQEERLADITMQYESGEISDAERDEMTAYVYSTDFKELQFEKTEDYQGFVKNKDAVNTAATVGVVMTISGLASWYIMGKTNAFERLMPEEEPELV